MSHKFSPKVGRAYEASIQAHVMLNCSGDSFGWVTAMNREI